MLRIDFPPAVRLVGQTSLTGAVCRDSTSRSWFCVFANGDPVGVDTALTGTVRFKAAAPRARQHGHVTYYLQTVAAGAGTIDTATAETATFSY